MTCCAPGYILFLGFLKYAVTAMCIFSADSLKRIWEFLRRNSLKNINPRNSGEKYSHHRPTLSFRYLIVLVSGVFIFAYFLPSAECFCAVRGDFFQNKRQTVTFFRFFDILLLRADGERIYRRDAKCEDKEAAAATRDLLV